jgi:hypothetical protein
MGVVRTQSPHGFHFPAALLCTLLHRVRWQHAMLTSRRGSSYRPQAMQLLLMIFLLVMFAVQGKLFSVSFYTHSPFLLAAGGESEKVVVWETDSVRSGVGCLS